MYLRQVFLFLLFFSPLSADPVTFYLTWLRNPETTMTIQWITSRDQPSDELFFKQHGNLNWASAKGNTIPLPEKVPYDIHQLEITQLSPNTAYDFKFGAQGTVYKFRTMPADLAHPVRFLHGGDFFQPKGSYEVLRQMNRVAAALDPQFIMCGGDLVYADRERKGKQIERWLTWLIAWKEDMIAPDGRVIPMIPIIGNHEVLNGGYGQTPKEAPYFYTLFAFPGEQGYRVLDFGKYMTLIGLDSGHTHPIAGPQTQWLNETLSQRKDIPYKFAIYHVAAFPSVRKWDGKIQVQIRKSWVPLFEEYNLDVAYENHDHAYKRSKPIKRNAVDPSGVIYIGDGGWAVDGPRTPKESWYIAKAAASRNMNLTIVGQNSLHFIAYDEQGRVLDESIKPFKNN